MPFPKGKASKQLSPKGLYLPKKPISITMQQILAVVGLVCAVWVIYDAWSKNHRLSETAKVLWTIAAILFSILTAIVYYVTQRMR